MKILSTHKLQHPLLSLNLEGPALPRLEKNMEATWAQQRQAIMFLNVLTDAAHPISQALFYRKFS
jgi:hypothetical protein